MYDKHETIIEIHFIMYFNNKKGSGGLKTNNKIGVAKKLGMKNFYF